MHSKTKTVLVVCYGNIHRSVIAQICLNRELKKLNLDKEIVCVSRGLQGTCGTSLPTGKNLRDYPREWRAAAPILKKLNINIPKNQQATPLDATIIREATVVLAMDRGVLIDHPTAEGKATSLIKQLSECGYKTRLFRELEGKAEDVPDCGEQSDRKLHERTINLIDRIARQRIHTLISLTKLFGGSEQLFLRVRFSPKEGVPPESWGWCDLSIEP